MTHQNNMLINNRWVESNSKTEVVNPFTNQVIDAVSYAEKSDIQLCLETASRAFDIVRKMRSWEKAQILRRVSSGLRTRLDEFARTISLEAAKPIRDSRTEALRAAMTFHLAANACESAQGHILPLDLQASSGKKFAIIQRFPVGPILAITPFNFPLNLVAHKIAPAIAAGCSAILKPSSKTPLTALLLGELLLDSGIKPGQINILPCSSKNASNLLRSDVIKMISFTGSAPVGWELKNNSEKRKITLELGGNAAVIIEPDSDIDRAVDRCIIGSFSYAGQICISVQRIYVHESIYEVFASKLVCAASRLILGDPLDETTDIGPMIDEESAIRTEEMILNATRSGANILLGGKRARNLFSPTILTESPKCAEIVRDEAFAPVVSLFKYNRFEDALIEVNNSRFGLQAGLFTHRWDSILRAFTELEVGGLIVNDVPTYRSDNYPYGGVKDSGFGREGIQYSIEEMTEMKTLALPE